MAGARRAQQKGGRALSLWRTDGPFLVGHRGGRGPDWPPENTLAAFERAAREGAPAVELDVRLCASGEVVVFHDEDLARLTEGRERAPVEALSAAEVRHLRLGASGEPVPFLADVLAWAQGRGVAVNVEMKHGGGRLAALARGTARDLAARPVDALVTSFHPQLLALFAARSPAVPRGLLTASSDRFGRWAVRWPAPWPALTALHMEAGQATANALAGARRRGLRVGVWTVNDGAAAADFLEKGAAWIITDAPGALRAAPALAGRCP